MNATRKNCTKSSISKYCTHATVSHKILPFDACLNSTAGVPTSRINNCAWNRVTYNGINQRNTCIVLFTWRDFKHFYITTLKKKKRKKKEKNGNRKIRDTNFFVVFEKNHGAFGNWRKLEGEVSLK